MDENGPALYHTDPAGVHTRYQAKAIGAGSEGAQTALKEHFKEVRMECHAIYYGYHVYHLNTSHHTT